MSGEVGWLLGCSLVLVLAVVTTSNLLRSRIGRALSTLATSPVAARSFGISPARLRSTAFLYSSALAAVGGGLFAGYSGFVTYEQFNVELSSELPAVVVLGGLGSVYGVVIAAVVLVGLPELVLALHRLAAVHRSGRQYRRDHRRAVQCRPVRGGARRRHGGRAWRARAPGPTGGAPRPVRPSPSPHEERSMKRDLCVR